MGSGCRRSRSVSASSSDIQCRWLGAYRIGGKTEASVSVVLPDIRGKETLLLSHSQRIGVEKRSPPPARLVYLNEAHPLLRSIFSAWCTGMQFSTENRLIKVYFAVPDLYVESAIRTGAHPGLVVNRCSLTTKVRQRHQIPLSAFLTLRERTGIQVPPPQLIYLLVKTTKYILSKSCLQGYFHRRAKFS
jgi:hypothetical protein